MVSTFLTQKIHLSLDTLHLFRITFLLNLLLFIRKRKLILFLLKSGTWLFNQYFLLGRPYIRFLQGFLLLGVKYILLLSIENRARNEGALLHPWSIQVLFVSQQHCLMIAQALHWLQLTMASVKNQPLYQNQRAQNNIRGQVFSLPNL